jgi:hypothetical protein
MAWVKSSITISTLPFPYNKHNLTWRPIRTGSALVCIFLYHYMHCTKSAHQILITYSILLLIHFLLLRLCTHKMYGLVTLGNLFCINSRQREQITQTMRGQASAAKWLRIALVWVAMQRVLVISAHFVKTQNRAVLT